MKDQATLGRNLSGIDVHKENYKRLKEATDKMQLDEVLMGDALAAPRSEFIKESGPVGSIPIPAQFKGALEMGAKMLKGVRPQALVDKLGERLAFERTGVRLYDALITKCEHSGLDIDLEQLRHFQREEAQHFKLLEETMKNIGADPTAITPGADVMAVASLGLVQVMTDPRTTPLQALEAILIAELADNDSWELLIDLTKNAGMEEDAVKFRQALIEEEEHLRGIRALVHKLMTSEGSLLQ